jgi:hypothetical protein
VFPITPSRSFSIQELMLGVVRLDVQTRITESTGTVIGSSGGSVTNDDGDALTIPGGALGSPAVLAIRRSSAADLGVTPPASFTVIAAMQVDAVGVVFGPGVEVSTAAAGVTAGEQVLVTRAFTDGFGQRRLRLIALADLVSGRLVSRATIGGVALEGIRGGGELVFLRAQQPIGFLRGTVVRTGGTPVPSAVVTTDALTLADAASTAGEYVVPAIIGPDVTIRAIDPASGDTASAVRRLAAAGEVLATTLTVAVVGPTVVAVSPAAGTTNVALDTPVAIDFSEPLDPASLTETTAAIQLGSSAIAAVRTLSADRRRVVIRPAAPLSAVSTYTIVLTGGIHDSSGNPLTGFTPTTFTTLDPSRPPPPADGRVVAELPDEGGLVLVTGAGGVAGPGLAVVVTNIRTQESSSVQSLTDGSFHVRIGAIVGDELLVTFRGTDGRDVTLRITQFAGTDGAASVGVAGGSFSDGQGRVGSVLPRGLSRAGIFRIDAGSATGLPALPGGFTYADAFEIETGEAAFRTLTSLTLSESQNRFAPAGALALPFSASGSMTVPVDALTSSAIQFSAVAQDADGTRRTISGATTIVASGPNRQSAEVGHAADFPTLFLSSPREAVASEQVEVSAVAPAARVDLLAPRPATVLPADTVLLVQSETFGGAERLIWVDRLVSVDVGGAPHLRTAGRDLPGITSSGSYALLATHDPLVFATGIASGPESVVVADGLPVAFRTRGPNGRFILPVRANQGFTVRFIGADGQLRGTATGQAPSTGSIDLGNPLGASAGRLTVRADPDERAVVDIGDPIVLAFSEPVDATTVASALIVTDPAGVRVFGRTTTSADGLGVTFEPNRRWRYGTRYRFGVGVSLLARSGARLAAPFTGEFTTFTPAVIGIASGLDVRDVAAAGATALAATATGFSSVDVSSPRNPVVRGSAVLGGAGAIASVASVTLTDRTGTAHAGPFALVATGGASAPTVLHTFQVADPTAPVGLGATQLSSAPGEAPPPGVPAFSGVPRAVVANPAGRGFVAMQSAGVASVDLGQAMPPDPSNPARGAGPRYPAGAESAGDVVAFGNRLAVAGVSGLTVLDQTSLARVGGISTTGDARGVAVLEDFPVDLNGDGILSLDTETLDVAAVANGIDGTLQLYQLSESADPVLISTVRFQGSETTAVKLDAVERLAYVGLGSRGLALVDLAGRPSVQPVDEDHDGIDDRVLGNVDTPGTAQRLSLDLSRGLVFVADGAAGLTVARVLPARTRFLSLVRDPVLAVAGEEESIADTQTLFVTDDALRVTVDAIEPVLLAIEEQGTPATPVLRFPDARTVTPLPAGLSSLDILVDKSAPATEKTVALTVLTADGQRVARVSVALRTPALAGLALESLRVGPENPPAMTASAPTLQLGVAGYFADGSVYNLTSAASGTTYATSLPVVAEIDGTGLVTGHAGGIATVVARNDTARDAVLVRVDGDRVLTSLRAEPSLRTLRTIGEELAFPLVATFSDGAQARGAAAAPGVVFASTDASIASVDAAGRLRAVSAGVAGITATRDTLSATLTVAVDPRTPSNISGIALAPPPAPLSLDDAPLFAVATVTGTGALDGLSVQVSITRGGSSSSETVHTDVSGAAVIRLDRDAEVGSIGVTAAVTDPASGAVRSDSRSFVIAAATGDVEPNDPASPAPLSAGRTAAGSVDPVGDPQDTYVFESTFGGTLQLDLRFAGDPGGSQLVIVIRDQEGRELARIGPTDRRQKLVVPILPGAARITVEGLAGTARYALTATVVQAPVSVGAVTPMGGPPGTLVTIDGGGFSSRLADNQVFFSGIPGEVVSATPTQLQVRVPAAAPNGAVEVISGDRRVDVGGFVTGQATRPSAYVTPNTAANVRRDPVSGVLLDINRLLITVAASATTADVEALAVRLGGRIVGFFPFTAQYVLEFPGNQTFDGLNLLRQRAAQEPQVRGVGYGSYRRTAAAPTTIDIFDRGRTFGNDARESASHEQIGLLEAIHLVRSTPPFTDREGFKDVRVAVIDSGFNPGRFGNEFLLSFDPVVEYLTRSPVLPFSPYQPTTTYTDTGVRHGTQVTSVIAAVNDGRTRLSGVMNSFFDPSERPLPVHVYRAESLLGQISTFDEIAALDHIRARTPAIDVINLSIGSYSPASTCTAAYLPGLVAEAPAIAAFRGRTLIVAAAGNDGVDARCHFPSALSRTEPHVVAVAATATDSGDGTPGEGPDDRAIFTGGPPSEDSEAFRRCSSLATDAGSNCGTSVTIAAPGEDILPLDDPELNLSEGIAGTSFAAPMVASIAAILQSIRPGATPMSPSELRSILTSTATAVMGQWNPDPRLKGAATPMARLNALAAVEAVLRLERSDAVYVADRKALGTATQPGTVVVVNVDPVTGTPATGPGATTTIDLTLRQGGRTLQIGGPVSLVTSRDGGRLYVFASAPDPFGDGIAIVDGTSRRTLAFVPLSGTPFPLPAGASASRPFRNYLPRPPMALSRDGRLLYVATGTGIRIVNALSGRVVTRFAELPGDYNTLAEEAGSLRARLDGLEQRILALGLGAPGGATISALELSPDGRTLFVVLKRGSGTGAQPGAVVSVDVDLYTDARPSPGLQSRLTSYLTVRASTVQSRDIPASDEPADAAVTPDGQRLYIVNSGINAFSALTLSSTDQQIYALRVVHQGTAGAPTVDPNLVEGVTRTLADGVVVLHAPGTIDVFNAGSLGDAERRYQSDVNFGWSPSAASGGLVMSPGQFGEVFAKRPATLAIRPDGKRALVAYAQTGNFGVLDVESQQHFRNPDARVGPTPGFFSGVVGVTPAVPMDKHLVPTTSAGRLLQFPTQIEYAQNGRFAAATHAGAVSVISDRSIDEDLRAHAGVMEPAAGGERAYFSQLPICASRLPGERGCERDVHTSLFEFVDSDGATKPFVQPLGIAVAPIVELRAPRFGDHITRTTAIHVRWGHPGVARITVTIFDLGSDGLDTPAHLGHSTVDVAAGERSTQMPFTAPLSSPPLSGHRYRIEVRADSASGDELSRSSIDVTVR